jgi:VWFA-related protein
MPSKVLILSSVWLMFLGCIAAHCATPGANTALNGEAEVALAEHLMPPTDAPGALAKAALPEYTIRRDVSEVRLHFSIADERGRLLDSVTGDNLQILDNQQSVAGIRNLTRASDLPLQIGVLLDVSDSVQKTVFREKQAAQFFLTNVFRPQTDHAFLLAFGRDVRLWQRSTGDRDTLTQTLQQIRQAGFATYLYDSVFYACLDDFPLPSGGDIAQRILVLFSDGEDTGSLHAMADAVALAQRREIQIFALSVHSPRKAAPGDSTLRYLADVTGGQFYTANSDKDFPAVFRSMEQQLRSQFAVSFQPPQRTAGYHAVQVEMSGGLKLRVHARQGYYLDAP